MDGISARMEKSRSTGSFETHAHTLTRDGERVGEVTITYYGPYFLSENDFRFISALNAVLLVTGLFACVFSIVTGWFLAKRITRPITKTADIAKRIAQGNYDIRFESRAMTRELGELALAVNHLAEALREQEKLRRRLTTDVAHELRTPLSAVGAHLEAMQTGIWEPTPERLQSCLDEITRLGKLVADLERLSKIESENLELAVSRIDLLETARAACGAVRAETDKKRLTLELAGETALVRADRDRISQVLTNLLSNAVKYTPEGGNIRVSVRDFPEEVSLTVEDDGIGIPEADLPLIFERFYRIDTSRSRKTGGAGIGLAIVKSIVTAHGGSVTADSRAGPGSRFTVTLPKNKI
jgi:signal transduction histidine kinase